MSLIQYDGTIARSTLSRRFRKDFVNGSICESEKKFLLHLPSENDHKGHDLGEVYNFYVIIYFYK